MKLENPPVIQTWIGFKFLPGSQNPPWNYEAVHTYLSRFESTLPHQEALFQTQFEIRKMSPTHRPRVVEHEPVLDMARARNEGGTHWLQIADNQMVYNRMRGEGVYLGYESLRDEALEKLSDYVDFFRPSGLEAAELHYVDLIEIPIPPEKKLKLDEYFELRVEIPDSYGPTWFFSTRLFLRPPVEGDILEVKLESEPPTSEATTFRFRVDWHMVCSGIASFEKEVLRDRLDQAHACLQKYFKASVTKRTWDFFQPSDGGH